LPDIGATGARTTRPVVAGAARLLGRTAVTVGRTRTDIAADPGIARLSSVGRAPGHWLEITGV
jgi:hypothetical protein